MQPHRLRLVKDIRGDLLAGEFQRDIPFAPKRYFLVFYVPICETCVGHAHRTCHQFLICPPGSCDILLDNGLRRRQLTIKTPDVGVYVPAMAWGTQFRYSADAMLLVFASEYYDPEDSIRSYAEFRALTLAQT